MRVVFLNSLEKNLAGSVVTGAQVWIGEEEGVWRMGWNETTGDVEQESIWYEGGSWSEMLHVYRHRLVVKLSEGFRPIIEGIWDEKEDLRGRGMAAQKLIWYSELNGNEEIYTELCAWRRKRASGDRKAPYLIATNRLLRLICAFLPQTIEELRQLPGVGESKAAAYGTELLEITASAERSHSFPLHWVYAEVDDDTFRSWLYKQKELKFRTEMERFSIRRKVLEALAEGVDLAEITERTSLERREALEYIEGLEKEGYDASGLIGLELKHTPQEEQEAIMRAYEELGVAFLKPVLKKVYGEEAAEGSDLDKRYECLRLHRMLFRRQREEGKQQIRSAV